MSRAKNRCIRCGRPAREVFDICADGNVPRHVCKLCDIALNAIVLDFMRIPNAAQKMLEYLMRKL